MKKQEFKKMRNILLAIIAIITALALVAYGSLLEEKRKSDLFTDTIVDYIDDEDDNLYRDSFMEGCKSEDGSEEECECLYNYLDMRMTNSEIVNMSLDLLIDDSDIPDIVYDASDYCL